MNLNPEINTTTTTSDFLPRLVFVKPSFTCLSKLQLTSCFQVHGFVFVVDATSSNDRMTETLSVLKEILLNDAVKGKPILLLGNKADHEDARDENQVMRIFSQGQLHHSGQK